MAYHAWRKNKIHYQNKKLISGKCNRMHSVFSAYDKSVVFALVGATFASAFILSHVTPKAKAEGASASTATVTVRESCSMIGTTNPPHTADLVNGTYSGTDYPSGIGQTTLKAFCNDNSGFAIYAIGYTNNEYGNTTLHWGGASNTSDTTNAINTGLYTAGSTTNSTWSMKLTSVSGTYAPTISDGTNNTENFTTWHVVPQEYTKVAYRTAGTDIDNSGTAIDSILTTTYDVYISNTQPVGTYIGQVKYTLVHPNKVDNSNKPVTPMASTDCPANSICYAPNASDIEGSMISTSTSNPTLTAISSKYPTAAKQTWAYDASGSGLNISASTTSITLITPNYKRAGFGFAGWSTDLEADNSSTVYGPNETITITAGSLSTNGMILYPVWIASTGNLQGWNGCGSLADIPTSGRATLASMTALKDIRDGNVYTVAKLADGKCWMTENLRLNNEATITTANTQSNNGSFGGVFTSLPQSVDLNWDKNTRNNLYTNLTVYTLPQLNTNNTNIGGKNASGTDLSISHNTDNDHVQWYSYGNYYSWHAAIADTKAHTKNNEHVSNTSICPTNWHLPEGGNKANIANSEFWALGVSLTGDEPASSEYPNYAGNPEGNNASMAFRAFPNNFIYSGFWRSSPPTYSRGKGGHYWSSSAFYDIYAHSLIFNNSAVYPGTHADSKYYGFTVRCVAGR